MVSNECADKEHIHLGTASENRFSLMGGGERGGRIKRYLSLCLVSKGYQGECTSLAWARVLGMPHLNEEEFPYAGHELISGKEI